MGNIWTGSWLDKCEVFVRDIKYTWFSNQSNWLFTCLNPKDSDVNLFMDISLGMGVDGNGYVKIKK